MVEGPFLKMQTNNTTENQVSWNPVEAKINFVEDVVVCCNQKRLGNIDRC